MFECLFMRHFLVEVDGKLRLGGGGCCGDDVKWFCFGSGYSGCSGWDGHKQRRAGTG